MIEEAEIQIKYKGYIEREKFIAEKLEGITFRVPVGQKSRIQEHAKSQGESTNAFIYRAVNEAIERDEKKADREE